MKNYFIIILCLLYLISCDKKEPEPGTPPTPPTPPTPTVYPGKWLKKTDFPGEARYAAFGFSLNDKIYMGGGHYKGRNGDDRKENFHKDFWEYDPATDTWTQKADLPFPEVVFVTSFTINQKGYITTGITDEPDIDEFIYSNDLWEYNPLLDEWKQKASFPGTPRIGAAGFSYEQKGYVGLGSSANIFNTPTIYYNDLWQYDAITDSWSEKRSFPGLAEPRGVLSLSTSQYGYAIINGAEEALTCWRYNFSSDEWTRVKDFEKPSDNNSLNSVGIVSGFVLNDQVYHKPLYLASSQPLAPYSSDFWMYDAKKDDWLKMASTPGFEIPEKIGFAVKNKGYLLLGHRVRSSVITSNDVWEYTPE